MSYSLFYLRYYNSLRPKGSKLPAYLEQVLSPIEVLKEIKGQVKVDAVDLETGTVARHDYKKPLPGWLEDPLIRQMVASTRKVP